MTTIDDHPLGPNILITGTPGTGKSTLCTSIIDKHHECGMGTVKYLNVNELAKEHNFYDGYDDELECHIIDEDKVCDELEDEVGRGGCVVDYHGAELFPQRWFDIVFVLTADTHVLYDRLQKRGYSQRKVERNMECEIFGTLLEEAQSSYSGDIVHPLANNSVEELERNTEQIMEWVRRWRAEHGVNT